MESVARDKNLLALRSAAAIRPCGYGPDRDKLWWGSHPSFVGLHGQDRPAHAGWAQPPRRLLLLPSSFSGFLCLGEALIQHFRVNFPAVVAQGLQHAMLSHVNTNPPPTQVVVFIIFLLFFFIFIFLLLFLYCFSRIVKFGAHTPKLMPQTWTPMSPLRARLRRTSARRPPGGARAMLGGRLRDA